MNDCAHRQRVKTSASRTASATWSIRRAHVTQAAGFVSKRSNANRAHSVEKSDWRMTGTAPKPTGKAIPMGIICAGLRLANDAKPELDEIDAEALVDTGALHLCIPEHVAAQLQLSQKKPREVITADGKSHVVP